MISLDTDHNTDVSVRFTGSRTFQWVFLEWKWHWRSRECFFGTKSTVSHFWCEVQFWKSRKNWRTNIITADYFSDIIQRPANSCYVVWYECEAVFLYKTHYITCPLLNAFIQSGLHTLNTVDNLGRSADIWKERRGGGNRHEHMPSKMLGKFSCAVPL